MKKALLIFGLCFALLCTGILCVMPPAKANPQTSRAAAADPWEPVTPPGDSVGDGSIDNPWKISQLNVTNNNIPLPTSYTGVAQHGKYFMLTENITLSETWTPRILAPHCVFDGNNHTISGLSLPTNSTAAKGFFSNMSGTVKNVTFANVNINPGTATVGSYIAAVAARVWNSPPTSILASDRVAVFSRVFVRGGSVRGASAVGGLVGEIANGCTVRIENCLNSANITGTSSGHVGGLVGRAGQESTGCELYVTRSANEGTIAANGSLSTTANGVGGIIGCIDGGPVTVEYCMNSGDVTRGHGGIIGLVRVASGRATIMNCFNDAAISSPSGIYRGAIVVRANASTIIWAQNNWANNTKFTGNLFTSGTTSGGPAVVVDSITGNGWVTSTGTSLPAGTTFNISPLFHGEKGLEAFVKQLNMGTESPAFIVMDDKVQLISVTRTRLLTFLLNKGENDNSQIQMHTNPSDDIFNKFPTETDIGERPYQKFLGWEQVGGDGTIYSAGSTYEYNDSQSNRIYAFTFTAKWEAISISVTFFGGTDAEMLDGSITCDKFIIGQENLTVTANSGWSSISGRSVWMILNAGAVDYSDANWTPLSNTSSFSLSEKIAEDANGVAFLRNHVVGEAGIIIKLVTNDNGTALINISSENADGGTFGYSLENSDIVIPVNISFECFSLADVNDRIGKIYVTAFEHYKILGVEIDYEPSGTSVTHYCPPDRTETGFWFTVTDVVGTGSSINVVFEKIQYSFDVETVLVSENTEFAQYTLPESLIDTSSLPKIVVNEDQKFSINALQTGSDNQNSFRFIGFKIFDVTAGNGGVFVPLDSADTVVNGETFATAAFTGIIDSSWLRSYLYRDSETSAPVIRIIAEYIPLYSVWVGDGSDSYWGVDGTFDVAYYLTDSLTGEAATLSTDTFHLVPEGSIVYMEVYTSLFAEDNDPSFFYQLLYFRGLDSNSEQHTTIGNQSYAAISVFSDRTINPWFDVKPFDIVFEAVWFSGDDRFTNIIQDAEGFSMEKTSRMTGKEQFCLGDTLESVTVPSITGYKFADKITLISEVDGSVTELSNELAGGSIDINEEFLFNYVSRTSYKITITAFYEKLYKLNVTVANDTEGKINVYKDEIKPQNLVYSGTGRDGEFDALRNLYNDDELIIEAKPAFGYEFYQFGGLNIGEGPEGNKLSFTLGTGRTIIAYFKPLSIDINETLAKKGFGTSISTRMWSGSDKENAYRSFDKRDEDLRIGDKIEIIAAPSFFGSEVKKWTINGIDIDTLGNVERTGNLITVTLTSDWYFAEGAKLDSFVEFGFTTEFIIFVLVPCSLVLILGIAFLFYFFNLQRKKRIIKAALLAEKRARAGFTQHNLVSDVREGKAVGGVSDEAVKAALQAQKTKGKKTDTSAADAGKTVTAPKPVKLQLGEMLAGGAVQADRTVVDKNKKKLGTLQKDGNIIGDDGSVIASIDIAKGTILDNDKNILGVVTGDGTIMKPE